MIKDQNFFALVKNSLGSAQFYVDWRILNIRQNTLGVFSKYVYILFSVFSMHAKLLEAYLETTLYTFNHYIIVVISVYA